MATEWTALCVPENKRKKRYHEHGSWPVERKTSPGPSPAPPRTPPGSPSILGKPPQAGRSFVQEATFFTTSNPIPLSLLDLSSKRISWCFAEVGIFKLSSRREKRRDSNDRRLFTDYRTFRLPSRFHPPLRCFAFPACAHGTLLDGHPLPK